MNKMKKRILITALLVMLSIPLLIITSSAENSPNHGSHGFYGTAYANVVNGKSDGFMIDFYSGEEASNALCTYYSNMNFGMYTKATLEKMKSDGIYYSGFEGGGAYGGLQITTKRGTSNIHTGIFSFWRYEYTNLKTRKTEYIYADAMIGNFTHFNNEGSGTSCVMEYPWQNGVWYRNLLLCWEDAETGRTFAGLWFYNYSTDTWDLFQYYDTHLYDSYIVGDIGSFLECFSAGERDKFRQFQYRNIYFLGHDKHEWVSSPSYKIRTDGNELAWGEAQHGISEDGTYLWAWADGTSEIDTDEIVEKTYKLNQEDEPPAIGEVGIAEFTSKSGSGSKKNEITLSWKATEHSTPQLSYKLELFGKGGELLSTTFETRPQVVKNVIDTEKLGTDAFKAVLTVTDVFGQTAVAEVTTSTYTGVADPTSEPTTATVPETTQTAPETASADTDTVDTTATKAPQTTEKEEGSSTVVIIVIASVAVVAAAGCAAFFIIKKKH